MASVFINLTDGQEHVVDVSVLGSDQRSAFINMRVGGVAIGCPCGPAGAALARQLAAALMAAADRLQAMPVPAIATPPAVADALPVDATDAPAADDLSRFENEGGPPTDVRPVAADIPF